MVPLQKSVSKRRVIYVPIGRPEFSTASTDWTECAGRVCLNLSKFDEVKAIYFMVTFYQANAGTFTCYAELYNLTDLVSIAGSGISEALPQYGTKNKLSGNLKANMPATEKVMTIRIKVESGGSCRSFLSCIIIEQGD